MTIYPYLNIGCGSRFLNNWTNVDFNSNNEEVLACNIVKGLPFKPDTFSVVYHSHVLEHLDPKQADFLLKECFRTLKLGGVLRIVVPDLEGIAQNYLLALNEVRKESNDFSNANYHWAVMELLDQLTREKSGGNILEYWKSPHLINSSTIEKRVGFEFHRIRESLLYNNSLERTTFNINFKSKIKDAFLKLFFGVGLEVIQDSIFRNSGEVHKWMYDSYSLTKSLERAGFSAVQQVSAHNSNIKGWSEFDWLDLENGKIRKPDSIFFEAIK